MLRGDYGRARADHQRGIRGSRAYLERSRSTIEDRLGRRRAHAEAQDGTEAVKRAQCFTPPPGAPRERVGHSWIDLSRVWLLHADRNAR